MRQTDFFTKAIERLDRLDKQSLSKWVEQLRREGQLLRQVLDSMREGVVIVGDDLQVQYMNRAAQIVLGSPSLLRVREPMEKMVEDGGFLAAVSEAVRVGKEIHGEVFEVFNPRHLMLEVTLRRLAMNGSIDVADERFPYVLVILPVSPRDERRNEQYRWQNLSSILSLASGIAHEIGNPLNSINIHLQLMQKDLARLPVIHQKNFGRSLRVVTEETVRLDRLVRNFLKATRRKPLRFQLQDINQLLEDCLNLLIPELKAKKIRLKTDLSRSMPKFFLDGERITQVLQNVVRNSIQAMSTGGTLAISSSMDRKLCRITFSDTGKGIPKKDLPHIFEAYFTTKEEGSGLGLLIAYQIIREHGGQIAVESKWGEGTTVEVSLPIRTEKLQLPAPPISKSGMRATT